MNVRRSPYVCHVFVCVNDRHGTRKSCADGGEAADLKALLKKVAAERGWKARVRISECGCLGLCEDGPNVLLYPQGVWFSGVRASDAEAILAEIDRLLASA